MNSNVRAFSGQSDQSGLLRSFENIVYGEIPGTITDSKELRDYLTNGIMLTLNFSEESTWYLLDAIVDGNGISEFLVSRNATEEFFSDNSEEGMLIKGTYFLRFRRGAMVGDWLPSCQCVYYWEGVEANDRLEDNYIAMRRKFGEDPYGYWLRKVYAMAHH